MKSGFPLLTLTMQAWQDSDGGEGDHGQLALASFGGILHTGSVREIIMACLQLEDLSHMMIASPLLRAYCENSTAAEDKWQKAVDKLNSMHKEDGEQHYHGFEEEQSGIAGDPRFIFDQVTDSFTYNTAFDGMSLRGKFNLLFHFQHLCINNLLGCFDLGSDSMHGGVCQWSAWRYLRASERARQRESARVRAREREKESERVKS